MQEKETASQPQAEKIAKVALTPHELYNYHIKHPNEPITDEDIRNLKLDSGSVSKEHQISEAVFVPPYDDENDNKSIGDGIASSDPTEATPKSRLS